MSCIIGLNNNSCHRNFALLARIGEIMRKNSVSLLSIGVICGASLILSDYANSQNVPVPTPAVTPAATTPAPPAPEVEEPHVSELDLIQNAQSNSPTTPTATATNAPIETTSSQAVTTPAPISEPAPNAASVNAAPIVTATPVVTPPPTTASTTSNPNAAASGTFAPYETSHCFSGLKSIGATEDFSKTRAAYQKLQSDIKDEDGKSLQFPTLYSDNIRGDFGALISYYKFELGQIAPKIENEISIMKSLGAQISDFENCGRRVRYANFDANAIKSAANTHLNNNERVFYDYFKQANEQIFTIGELESTSDSFELMNQYPALLKTIGDNHKDITFTEVKTRINLAKSQADGSFIKQRRATQNITPFTCLIKDNDATPRTRLSVSDLYPPSALEKNLSGTVKALVQVDETGKVTQSEIIEATNPVFASAELSNELKKIKFWPKTSYCVTMPTFYVFSINFKVD
jgi:hypothetical protein